MMMITSMWESMAAWLTPTVLFCLTNFIIATLFIASHKHHDHADGGDSPSLTPFARVSSFIDRARSSVNLSSYTTTQPQHHQQPQPKTPNYSSMSQLAQSIYSSPELSNSEGSSPSPPKTPNYSSMSRLAQSIYLSPELSNSEGSSPSQAARTPSLFERVKSIKFSNENVSPVESDSPSQLARVPSFLDRVKSFKVSLPFNRTENVDTETEHHVIRSKSEKKPAKKSLVEMKKSRSEVKIARNEDEEEEEDVDLRRPATTRESRNELDEEVDAKADDFISRFKQQLKLQRLESLVRYNEMLNRRYK
ncbi:hypothetical protein HanHA300_Chr06g0213331 [Helianthus annuus]|nr:hypothetical protein HanHA300_Chr06g0213331 [Helianthus annuus]